MKNSASTSLANSSFKNVVTPIPGVSIGTAQLDHCIVSPYGIFVIETKNRNGLIRGNPEDKYWQQSTDGQVYTFQNPLRQNEGHIAALVRLTSLPRWAFHSVIYFCGNARFTRPMPGNVRTGGITTWVYSKNKPILWPDEIEHAWRRLLECKEDPNLSMEKHIQNINTHRRSSNCISLHPNKILPNIKKSGPETSIKNKKTYD